MGEIEMMFGLDNRHRRVEELIHRNASQHRVADGVIGGISNFVPLPFVASATTAALVMAQSRLVYRPLSKKIANIYSEASPIDKGTFFDEVNVDEVEAQKRLIGIQNNLYNIQFLIEISRDLMSEAVAGNLIAAIPFIGFAAAAAMDAMIAATMTWRVGLMTAIFYCNAAEWVGSRKETFEIAKKHVGPLSIRSKERIDIGMIVQQEEALRRKQVDLIEREFVCSLIRQGKSEQEIADEASEKAMPSYILSELPALIRKNTQK